MVIKMANILRCPLCNGSKKVVGIGLIEKKCPDCSGVGFIEETKEERNVGRTDSRKEKETLPVTQKRRGRPRRVQL